MAAGRWRHLLVVSLLALSAPGTALAAWVLDEAGTCVGVWSAASLVQGPTAIASGTVLPVRCGIGGLTIVPDDLGTWGPLAKAGGILISGAFGALEGVTWIGRGLADTVTGGYFDLSPERATKWSWSPTLPFPRPLVDRCGRPIEVTAPPEAFDSAQ